MANEIDNKAFQSMLTSSEPDATTANLFPQDNSQDWSKDVHNALMAAGFVPGMGNIADAADALLYSLEGEFGQAALSLASIVPFAGQLVAAKRTAKIVKRVTPEDATKIKDPFDRFLAKHAAKQGYIKPGEITKDLIIDGKTAGHISGKVTPLGISVNGIIVDKKYRRLGFGTDLYKSLQEETTGFVYSRGWQQNPETARKVWESLVKSDVAEMIPSGKLIKGIVGEPVYFLKKEGVNIGELLKGAINLPY